MTPRDLREGLDLTGLLEETAFWDVFCFGCKAVDARGECLACDGWDERCPRHRELIEIQEILFGAKEDIWLTMPWAH